MFMTGMEDELDDREGGDRYYEDDLIEDDFIDDEGGMIGGRSAFNLE